MDAHGEPRGAVEPVAIAAPGAAWPPPFRAGIAVGVVLAALAAHAWVVVHIERLRAAMGGWTFYTPETMVSPLTRLALYPAWQWGAPVGLLAALLALRVRRVGRTAPYVALAVAALVIVVGTYHYGIAPITQLAGAIRE